MEAEEDPSQLPFPDRFAHKNWKVRKEGYEAAAKEFECTPSESAPVFKQFLQESGLWKDAASDSNVAAQQEGLTALCAFLKYGGPQAASKSRASTVEAIRDKGLSSTRSAVKAAALEALLLYTEFDKPSFIVEELLPALSHKQPKIIAANLSAITAMFHNFGCKILDPKPILKALPKVFGHADKNVRAEATNLAVELYRWLREAIKAIFWEDLKPVQQQDLEKMFEKVREEPPPKQERLTRAQQAAEAAAAEAGDEAPDAEGSLEQLEDEEPVIVSAFDLAEPVDVLSKIPKDLHENLASSKWKERKDALDGLLDVLNTPRIKDAHFDDIIRVLAKVILKDAHVAVVGVSANCVEKLALGTGRGFAKYRTSILSPMLERCKEKKQVVTDALAAALDAVFASASLSDCLEEILGFLTHKNPQVKLETIKFLTRCLSNTRDVPSKVEVKSVADAAIKLLTESTEGMRNGGAAILGTLMKIMGERAMGPYLDGVDDIRKAKIKEFFESAVVKAKDRPKPIAPPPKAAGKNVAGPGMKKPPGAAKLAGVTAAPPPEDEPVASKTQPTARSLAKPGSSRTGSGLSVPVGSKLGALKKPSGGAASPQRRVISPVGHDEMEPPAPSPSKFGAGRGGLAGRTLSKPTPAPSLTNTISTPGVSSFDQAELEELRSDKERLSSVSDSLRSSNTKLTAEISELQNQNAQLIEDHTRDVLQMKAKETQLVRARGECEVLSTELEYARKEIERQKREMSRLGRESFGRDHKAANAAPASSSSQEDTNTSNGGIYMDSNVPSGKTAVRPSPIVLSRAGSSTSVATAGRKLSNSSSRTPSYRDRFEVNSTNNNNHNGSNDPSDEKENTNDGVAFPARRKLSPPSSATSATFGNGATSPQRSNSGNNPPTPRPSAARSETTGATNRDRERSPASSTAGAAGTGEPAENWKRAAEVTSQLKARIEQMKARQGISRPTAAPSYSPP